MKVLVASRDRVEASEHAWPQVSQGWGSLRNFCRFYLNRVRGSVRAWCGFPRRFSNKVPQPQGA